MAASAAWIEVTNTENAPVSGSDAGSSPQSEKRSTDVETGDVDDRRDTQKELDGTEDAINDHSAGYGLQSIIVDWDGTEDPDHPQNFSRKKKFVATFALAGPTLVVTFSSSVFAAATVQTAERFNVSNEVMILGTSLFVLGFGLGPTVFGPMSELYGRKRPLFLGFFGFAVFQIPVAVATNIETVMVCRFLQGFFGSSCPAIVGGVLADIWDQRERGFAMPSFAGSLFAGPIFGPIIGAYVSSSYLGWRWTQWITLIMAGFFGSLAWLGSQETHGPTLLTWRARRLRHSTGNWALHARHEESEINLKEIAQKYLERPIKMLVLEPILTLVTLYLAFVYGLIYLFFEAYPISFQGHRGWSAGVASLPFISILIGVFLGCALIALTTKTKLAPDFEKGRNQETRLLLMAIGGIVLPIGLFWYAWTSSPSINPAPQIIAGVPIGFGLIIITLQGINYTIDCYTIYANSAIAALTFVRSFFGAGFPLFAGVMFTNLGVAWATTVLGFIAVALIPVPVLFYKVSRKDLLFPVRQPSHADQELHVVWSSNPWVEQVCTVEIDYVYAETIARSIL